MKKNLTGFCSLFLGGLCLLSCQTNPTPSSTTPPSTEKADPQTSLSFKDNLDILFDGDKVDTVRLEINQEKSLSVRANNVAVSDATWSIQDPAIVSVSSTGTLKGLKTGTTSITITSSSLKGQKTIFVQVNTPVLQEGIGSGKNSQDPIFKGNEGQNEPLEIYFIEMQHIYSDSIYIRKGNVDILIDAGWAYDGTFVNRFLKEKMKDNRLDLMVATHGDDDHIQGFSNAMKNIENVSLILDYNKRITGDYGALKKSYIDKGTSYHDSYDCVNNIDGGLTHYYLTSDFYFDVLNTNNYVDKETDTVSNINSVTLLFYYKDFKFFTAGDLTAQGKQDLLRKTSLPNVTLYKASHHGSTGSNTTELLNTLAPKGVGISAARADNYLDEPGAPSPEKIYNLDASKGHPHQDALQRIYNSKYIHENRRVYWNAVNGTMCFSTYGKDDFTFHGSQTMKGYYDLTLTDGKPVWDESIHNFKNKVTGEEDKRFSDTKAFVFRDYDNTIQF